MLCMNTSLYAIVYPFKHMMCLSCYLRYILSSKNWDIFQTYMFLATAFMKDLAMISCL